MKKKSIQQLVYELVDPAITEIDYELVAVEYLKEGANWFLRLYIDKQSGAIDLDDCQAVSAVVSDLLDRADPVPNAYFLEVSSPGIERLLQREKDFKRYFGSRVNVHTYAPVDGAKIHTGTLGLVTIDALELNTEDTIKIIPREKISQVRLAWDIKEA